MAQGDEHVYVIDGATFTTLEAFFRVVSRELVPDGDWGHNLDGFNDILRGGFGTPASGFTLRWKNSALSRRHLGYPETVRQLRQRLGRCHPDNRSTVTQDLERAAEGTGPTVFDWLVEIIRDHEDADNVRLELA